MRVFPQALPAHGFTHASKESPVIEIPAALVLIGVLLVLGLGALISWEHGAESRALKELRTGQRRALYESTWKELETLCHTPVPRGLERRCEAQRRFILEFPECNDACRALVARQRSPLKVR
jgi:hypothetical protein